MKKPLMWKLFLTIVAGTMVLSWALAELSKQAEQRMSHISEAHQQALRGMAQTAEDILAQDGEEALAQWVNTLQEQENTWVAVVRSTVSPLAGGQLSEQFTRSYRLGRSVDWKVHLYFNFNPIMDIPIQDPEAPGETLHFLIRLPERMRPGEYLPYTSLLLKFFLPFMLFTAIALILYRHVMRPIKQLDKATQQFTKGDYEVQVTASINNRHDELSRLTHTFNGMTAKIGNLILTQRQLIADLSHELRTPLARVDMAVDCIEHGIKTDESMQRLRKESITMRQLVEDTLTLAWLENEKPTLTNEEVDLIELLELLVEDAQFEYSDRQLSTFFPTKALLPHSSHRALAQAFENIIRNALKYTPVGGTVGILVKQDQDHWYVQITDQGPGVPDAYLQDIFQPFFRVEKSRNETRNDSEPTEDHTAKAGGFGLGLALARRQIEAVGGSISAKCAPNGGLMMQVWL